MAVPIPPNDPERVEALQSYDILDTPQETDYDELTELIAQICQCPVAYIGFIDAEREVLKSKCGLPPDLSEVPRDITICATTVCMNDLLVVPDLAQDARFADLPMVSGEPHLRFYCGMPLINPEGYAVGSLCVVDFEPKDLEFGQKEAVRRLSHQVVKQLELRRSLIRHKEALDELQAARRTVDEERARSDRLLLNILPTRIAEELKEHDRVTPRFYESATVLFTDFQDFTTHAERMEPKGLVDLLDQYFSTFDDIVAQHNLEKLKTIGDAYMCAGGLPEARRGHAIDACLAALELQRYVRRTNAQREKLRMPTWELRIGIHTGPVMAGVVGKRKFTYDIWGDTVNVAARMETAGEPGKINISESTRHHVERQFQTEPRGAIEVKNKGMLDMYFLTRIRPEFSRDADGCLPNERFAAEQVPVHRDFSSFTRR